MKEKLVLTCVLKQFHEEEIFIFASEILDTGARLSARRRSWDTMDALKTFTGVKR